MQGDRTKLKTPMKTRKRRVASALLFASVAALTGLRAPAGMAQDDDLPTVTIGSASSLEGRVIVFPVRLDKPNPTSQIIGFSWRTEGITATPNVDYEESSYTASFLPGETESDIVIITIEDDVTEGSETFRLIASDPRGVKLGNTEAIGTITELREPSDLPDVVIFANRQSIEEGEEALFTLDASPRPAAPMQVTVDISQTGAFAAPGQTGRRTVTVDSSGRGRVWVATADDNRNEATGAIRATLVSGPGYRVDWDYGSASTEVTDNDLPAISIRAGPRVGEGGTATFTLSASPRPATPIDVSVTVTENGEFASDGQLGARTVTIATNGRGTLEVRTDNDAVDEDDGSITASLGSGRGYSVGSPASASVVVTDGGAPTPVIGIRARSSGIVEGGAATFELTASPRPADPVRVRVEVTDSGRFASPGQTGTRTVTIGTSGNASFVVTTDNDLEAEPDGFLTVEILSGTGYRVASDRRASVAVRDDSIEVSIRSAGDIVEGETATFTLIADSAPPEDLNVGVSIAESGRFLPGGAYTTTVTVGADGRGSLTVDTVDDGTVESDGSITAVVQPGRGYAPGSPARATARVSDSTPTVTIAAGGSIIEGDTATFSLTADPAPANTLTVRLDVSETGSGNFASPGETGDRTAVIFSGGTGTLEVRTDDDEVDEGGGEITARIITDGASGRYRIGSPASGSLRVNDNDYDEDDVAVSVADAEIREGVRNTDEHDPEHLTILKFAVTLNRAAENDVTAHFETRPFEDPGMTSAATAGSDYRDNVPMRVRFEPGETEKIFAIVVYDDDEHEELPETFELVIGRVEGAEIADGVALGKILPDPADAPRGVPVVTITGGAPVDEGESVTFTLTARPAPEEDLAVDVTVFDDSVGRPSSDYLADSDEGTRKVTIPGTDTHDFRFSGDSVATLTLQTIDDSVEEASGKVRVQIELADDGRYDANQEPWQAEIHVRDNDGEPPAVTPAFSVADATANESDGLIVFDVSLDPPVPEHGGPMTVFYQILGGGGDYPGAAKRNVDFVDKFGTLTFHEGESRKAVEIEIIDDDHDEGDEMLVLYISRPTGGATIADAAGWGVIVNSDPMPQAWLGRFGRALAEQAVEGIADRIEAGGGDRAPGFRGFIAGQPVGGGPPFAANACGSGAFVPHGGITATASACTGDGPGFMGGAAAAFAANRPGPAGFGRGAGPPMGHGDAADTRFQQLLLGSRFTHTGKRDANGGVLGFWGRGSRSRFDGADGGLGLDGEVTTAMLGADYARDDWLVGVALTQSLGGGGYRRSSAGGRLGAGGGSGAPPMDGGIDASLTAAMPYASWRASERLKLWGAAGYGVGEMTLEPEAAESIKADTGWRMAAAGLRSDLFSFAGGGKLALDSDALWVRTGSERANGLVATDARVSRLRIGLEGSRRFALPGGGGLTPQLEVGARRDGGDAETGFGVEVGGGIAWSDPRLGLRLDLEGRTLVTHEDGAMKNRGFSASLTWDPRPDSARGLSFALRQDAGGLSRGGLEALFANDPSTGRHSSHPDRDGGRWDRDGGRWTAEMGYGLPAFGGRFTGAPHLGYGVSYGAHEIGLGWRLAPEAKMGAPDLSLAVQATRRENPREGPAGADRRVGIEVRARW